MDNSQHLAVIDEVEAALAQIEAQGKEVIDFETDEGYKRAKELKKPLVKIRKRGDEARLAATKYHRDEQKRINDMWKGIAERIEAVENPLTEGIKKVDEEKKRIEAEKLAAEQKRIDDIKERINDIRMAAGLAVTLDDVQSTINRYNNVTLESFEEFADEAERAIAEMDTALNAKKKQLEEQAELEAKLEAQRQEQERIAEEQRKEREAFEAERRRIAEEQRAEREKLEAEQRAIELEKARQEEARKAEEQRKIDAERAEEAKQQAIARAKREEAERIERERIEAEEREAAEKAEEERLAALAPDAEKINAWMIKLLENQLPEMSTDEARDLAIKIRLKVTEIRLLVDDFENGRKAA